MPMLVESGGMGAPEGMAVPAGPGQWPLVPVTQADLADVQALFIRIFGHELSQQVWHWKYGDGRGLAVGMRDQSGQLVAHYGGTLRPVSCGVGRVATAAQVGDVMVAPEVRDVWARFGPFGRVARDFIDRYLGSGRGEVFGFGFPNVRHMRLGQRLGLYSPLDEVRALTWSVADFGPGAGAGDLMPVDWADSATVPLLSDLGRTLHAQWTGLLAPVRDGFWWRHRFANHPEHVYACFWWVPHGGGIPEGALVLRQVESGRRWELMDWIGTAEACSKMLPAALSFVRGQGAQELFLWATQAALESLRPSACLPFKNELACPLASTHAQLLGRAVGEWGGRTWFTGGDTDFR